MMLAVRCFVDKAKVRMYPLHQLSLVLSELHTLARHPEPS
jgi:hypothetical protein